MNLHKNVAKYLADLRYALISPPIPHVRAKDPSAIAYYLYALDKVTAKEWHWLGYLFAKLPPNQNLWEFALICSHVAAHVPDLGVKFVDALADVCTGSYVEAQYEQMLQIFAEVFCIYRILKMPWSKDASFQHEPKGANGKRPEFRVLAGGAYFIFEVKAPSLLEHQRRRARAPTQIPARLHPDLTAALNASGGGGALMPRDNPVKDFLVDANNKFVGFESGGGVNILIIVWDDFIYEPLASLIGETGLLTVNSFNRIENKAVQYRAVDMVVCMRHLSVFQQGLAERELLDGRETMFDFGSNPRTPNVHVPTPWGKPVPELITNGLSSLNYNDEVLRDVAEYRTPELIIWLGGPTEIVSNDP